VNGVLHCGGLYVGCGNDEFDVVSGVICFLQVWAPTGNKKFETLSYLPPLTNDQIAKQIDYMLGKNLIPCLEFDLVSVAIFLEIAL
jgi:hypothetical protein